MAMPIINQEQSYSGHKRCHALKFQFVATPDGLLFVSPPQPGPRHDGYVLSELKLVQWAQEHARGIDGEPRYLYGDQSYSVSAAVIAPFKGNFITRNQMLTNHIMSKYRVTVEWGIGMISMQWSRFRDKLYQRTGLTPCGRDFLVGTLLRNALTSMHGGNQISYAMQCRPPSIGEYFSSSQVAFPMEARNPVQEQHDDNDNKLFVDVDNDQTEDDHTDADTLLVDRVI